MELREWEQEQATGALAPLCDCVCACTLTPSCVCVCVCVLVGGRGRQVGRAGPLNAGMVAGGSVGWV